MKRPTYADPWLVAYAALMLIATLIAAHGAYTFFSYMLPPLFAILATVVTAGSIPALDAAGTLERSHKRWLYWLGAALFLLMETLANYFAAQAVFVANVRRALAEWPAADLVRIAEHPAGRALVVLFLAMPSGIVAYFAYILAERVRSIREARASFAHRSRRSSQLRGLVVKLARMVREVRTSLVHARAEFERVSRQLHEAHTSHARSLTELREQLAAAQAQAREAQVEAAKSREQLEQARELAREKCVEVAKLHEQPANDPPTRTRIVAYLREQLATGRSRLDVSRELNIADATLRGWMEAEQPVNGVEVLN